MLDTKRMKWVPDVKKKTFTPEDISKWYIEALLEYNRNEYPIGYTLEKHIGNYIHAKVTK